MPMRKPSQNIRRVVALLLLSLTCAAVARGQRAYKIDETDYARCDLSEVPYVTDLSRPLFVELGKHPEAQVAIVVYGKFPGDTMSYARRIKRWLTETRGVAAQRVLAVYGGHAQKTRIEIWLVPAGAEPPPEAPPVGRAGITLFGSYGFWPGETCPDEREPVLEIFAEILKRLPGWRGTVVINPNVNLRAARVGAVDWDPEAMTRRQALRRAAGERLYLIRQLGLDPARIRAVVGSPASYSHAQLWLIPPAAPAPGGR